MKTQLICDDLQDYR